MTHLTLVSHRLCPYVQRAAIALDEKGVAFERIYVDLADKPDWFTAISPLGKVPLLIVRHEAGPADARHETVLFESAAILEYLEESQERPLHPADPLMRARHRAWIEFGSAILNAIWRFYTAPDEAALAAEAARLGEMFQRIEDELGTGPWFAGARFGLVDAAFGPVFRYFDTFDRIGDFAILSDKPKTMAWRGRLAGRASVENAVSADFPARLETFLLGRRSALSRRIQAMSREAAAAPAADPMDSPTASIP